MESSSDTAKDRPQMPQVWEYTDYRAWLSDTFKARKAIHSWYSYAVLAQRSGFQARDFLMRVMRGDRSLSLEGADRLADALDLARREKSYFLALVQYNQAKKDSDRELAWAKVQRALLKSGNVSSPRMLTDIHREILSEWHHLAIRSLLEMEPHGDDWDALGKKLHPARTAAVVRRSVKLLRTGGLVEKLADGLWHATEKSIATPPEVGNPAVRQFHRDCLKLAESALEDVPSDRRNITGLTLGISERTYRLVCDRLTEMREELSRLADADDQSDRVYQLTLAMFPLSTPNTPKDQP